MDHEGNMWGPCNCEPPKMLRNDEECEECGMKLDRPAIERAFGDMALANFEEAMTKQANARFADLQKTLTDAK